MVNVVLGWLHGDIQFNSIQFNTDICTRQLMNITLARTAKKQNYREK